MIENCTGNITLFLSAGMVS